MENVITAVTTGLSADAIWGAIGGVVTVAITITLIAITRRIVNKNLNAAAKGKSGRV